MKDILLVYIYVPGDDDHWKMAHQFLDSYSTYPPEYFHRTVVVCQNDKLEPEMREKFSSNLPQCSFYVHDDSGFDIGAFIAVAKEIVEMDMPIEFAIFCGGSTFFQHAGWLKRIAESWQKLGPGVYGANATYEVSPHLNTSGFWCEPKLLAEYPIRVVTRQQRYDFEHGPNAFWKKAYANGVKTMLVTWDGEYDWKHWRAPQNGFRRGDQSNCLIYWHHHLRYDAAAPKEKSIMRGHTDVLRDPLWVARRIKNVAGMELAYLEKLSAQNFLRNHNFKSDEPKAKTPRLQKHPSITVVAVTGVAPKSHAEAINRTVKCIPYPCQKLLVAPSAPIGFDGQCIAADAMLNSGWSIESMQRFLMSELADHIKTDICVLVQWDGYAINPDCWSDHFFDFDYIGAPWPGRIVAHLPVRFRRGRVGNGGFSIRSKRWLEACAKLQPSTVNEDFYASCINREYFEKQGCRIAPMNLAIRWSLEHVIEEYPRWKLADSFGFHGLTDKDPNRSRLRLNPNE